MRLQRQTLIFDADDTLWENNVLFERVFDDYLDWLDHPTLDRDELRRLFDEIAAANTVAHGYGSRVFLRTLRDCFGRLSQRSTTEAEARQIEELAAALSEGRVDLIPGVATTLRELAGRHQLLLMTKGDVEEQQRKIDASTLADHFESTHIVAEKNTAAYRRLVEQHSLSPDRTWMIGNSPKSDILPARDAGLKAVFIPNENTWALEHGELDPDDADVLQLNAFAELVLHF